LYSCRTISMFATPTCSLALLCSLPNYSSSAACATRLG
jgi:hypothetical protein